MVEGLFLTVYIAIVLLVSFFSMRRIKGMDEYLLGSRSINPWMSAFSYGTAYFSAVLFIGYAGKTGWSFGLSGLWVAIGNTVVGSLLAWLVLGKRTREMTQRLGVSTMPGFIGIRYNSKALKIVSALIIFVFLVPYSASVYMGLSYLFEQIFHIPYTVIMIIMALFTALYLFIGGFLAETIMDFIQGIVMIIGTVLMVFFVINSNEVGGLSSMITSLKAIDPKLIAPVGPGGFVPLLSLVVLTSLGTWGLPQMIHKFYTVKDGPPMKAATVVSTLFALLISGGVYFVGSTSRIFFPDSMPMLNGVPNPDLIIPQIISPTLPEIVLSVIMVLVLAASMSTLASIVMASASAIAVDLIQDTLAPKKMNPKHIMLIMRVLCVVFVGLSLLLALVPNPIISLMSLSWGAVAGSLLAPYLYGLYWRGTTRAGVWAGIITSLGISIGGALYAGLSSPLITVFSAAAIVIPIAIVPAVSAISAALPQQHIDMVYNTAEEIA
ncbi:sodium:solute symporter family transporter [Mahella australiensis]|uniref:Na+/solute symporter n=1 Tax=Mahella australiensis (strain DSM 15567 / CIP 107919 / 50-1 BON) TaxID=697281 RepID=F4A3A0_MAHA5|nr:sodium:solute symporter [Mahella australiensis]AEE97355.1 Na+/solute symporter [Mahella australiensis 50-1 BON]